MVHHIIVNAVATLGTDSNNQMSRTDDDDDRPTEEEINEWTRRSREEGICGIASCFNKPTTRCKKCTNYYCSEHFSPHLDLLPDSSSDFEYNNNIASSSNDGLELYMEDEPD
ncbi:MAG: hypothetical protein ACRD8W_23170, partial [Nitrososphaeraceae archaeon]